MLRYERCRLEVDNGICADTKWRCTCSNYRRCVRYISLKALELSEPRFNMRQVVQGYYKMKELEESGKEK